MKLINRTHRIIAVAAGIVIVVLLTMQIIRDVRVISANRAKQEQLNPNTNKSKP
jgi:hypothetical protein